MRLKSCLNEKLTYREILEKLKEFPDHLLDKKAVIFNNREEEYYPIEDVNYKESHIAFIIGG
jgi:hypothetical protein